MTPTRLRSPLPAALATIAASVLLAGTFTWVVAASNPYGEFRDPGTDAWDVGALAGYWGGASILALPLGFLVGMLGLVVLRSFTRRGEEPPSARTR